ncbi:MAG: Maf family protein [Gammaproteobacteria bacterium]
MKRRDDSSRAIILASASPRRCELLAVLGLSPEVRPVAVDESVRPGEAAAAYVERLADTKARAAAEDAPEAVVIAADTAVVLEGRIYGKPTDAADFRRMMHVLGGGCHEVYTGVAVVCRGQAALATSVSRVCLRPLSEREIEQYWASGEPRDKAGGYAIQGLGSIFVAEMHGSYSGVVGLPLFETAGLLADAGVDLLDRAAHRDVR